jgi:putative spermidine/putrescine transport system permease protein
LLGAAIFSFTLSFNEFSRTTLVRSATDTLPTYVWGRVQNLGLDPTIYAVSALTIILSAVLLAVVGSLLIRTD